MKKIALILLLLAGGWKLSAQEPSGNGLVAASGFKSSFLIIGNTPNENMAETGADIRIYSNPKTDRICIKAESCIKSIYISDTNGRLVLVNKPNGDITTLSNMLDEEPIKVLSLVPSAVTHGKGWEN